MSMKSLALAVGAALLMAACASEVKLDGGAPVDDRSSGGAGATTGAVEAKSAVASVDLTKPKQDAIPAASRLIYFDYDSFVIKPEFQSSIESHAGYIKSDPGRKVVIEGHTDERGGREYNLALGQKRAEAVRRAMGLLGVGDSQVEAVSFGKEKPAIPGNDEAAWSKNRRAEISYR
jgi:peptidoglycan-associated lipoprotein